jgi:hypothetical protein
VNELNPQQPVHVGTLNGMPLRFYPPQSSDDMMPWVAMDDFATALGMKPTARMALLAMTTESPNVAKRIQTESGALVDVLAFQGVQGVMGALKQRDMGVVAVDMLHMALVQELMTAAEKLNPLLFDRDVNGEFIVNSRMMAMLLGEDHEALVARIKAEGIDAKERPGPQVH